MADIRERAQKDRNILQKILGVVPGFRGYLQKEERRETDKILREHLALKMDRLRHDVDPVIRDLTDSGGLALVGQVDRLKKLLEKATYRLRYAPYGYSGFFDAVRVDNKELDRLYEFDADLLDRIGDLERAIAELAKASSDKERMQTMTREILNSINEFDTHLDRRQSLIEEEKDRN